MTDEELSRAAAELLRPYFRDTLAAWEVGCVAEIAAALADAAAAERERCARLVESADPCEDYRTDANGEEWATVDWPRTAELLARRIREGGE